MTAMSTSVERVVSRGGECEVRFAYLTAPSAGLPSGGTYTPTNNTGATIKILGCYDDDYAYDAVKASVSAGVIYVDAAGTTTLKYNLLYALYR